MTTNAFTESTVEQAAMLWFWELGYQALFGPEIAPGEAKSERDDFGEVILKGRLTGALEKLNPNVPATVLQEVVAKLTRSESPNLIENNHRFHRYLTDGVDVEFQNKEGRIVYDKAWLIDFENPEKNNYLAVNQFTVIESKHNRRPDIVIFINGLPLAVIELKNPADENATVKSAFQQIQTYKNQIPGLFHGNALVIASDGTEARMGSLSADWERFMPWRRIDGEEITPKGDAELEVITRGVFTKERFLDLIRHFIVFERNKDTGNLIKKIAGYHQCHAVNKAVGSTIRAASKSGDKRAGVVWHTQGSGKSLSMAFYAGKIVSAPQLENPTIVVLTDRNDLDGQLFDTFSACNEIIRQTPMRAESRSALHELLSVASGGVIFTTIQKFFPK